MTFDTTSAVTAIEAGGTAVGVIALASFLVVVGLKIWKRLRGAA